MSVIGCLITTFGGDDSRVTTGGAICYHFPGSAVRIGVAMLTISVSQAA